MTKWDSLQECKGGSTFKIRVLHMNQLRKQNYMIVSVDSEKSFDKIHCLLIQKTSIKKLINTKKC